MGVLAVVENAHHHLGVSLGLMVGDHYAETHQGVSPMGHKTRNNGVIGAFGAGHAVGVAGDQ